MAPETASCTVPSDCCVHSALHMHLFVYLLTASIKQMCFQQTPELSIISHQTQQSLQAVSHHRTVKLSIWKGK